MKAIILLKFFILQTLTIQMYWNDEILYFYRDI